MTAIRKYLLAFYRFLYWVLKLSIVGWLPPEWQKAIVPIAIPTRENNFQPIGTGFLLHYNEFNCVITAKHVVLDKDGQQKTGRFILLNQKDGRMKYISLDETAKEGVTWKPHPEKDLAATICPLNPEIDDFRRFTPQLFEEFANIREGDDVFFLGFPLGITTPERITPIVRGGMIALRKNDDTFLIDANVFPGNSGSPVFFKPSPFELTPKGLTLGKIRPPKLIGVISSYISYLDVAISRQTHRPRISFEENSGLADVLSVRFIRETLDSSDFRNMLQMFSNVK